MDPAHSMSTAMKSTSSPASRRTPSKPSRRPRKTAAALAQPKAEPRAKAQADSPLYAQVERALAQAISAGAYRIGDQIPTEAELCARHGVSRHTVREALRRLQDLGMIERRTSAGTRVVSARPISAYQPDSVYQPVAESTADILSLVEQTRIARPTSARIKANRALARRLRCRVGTPWFKLAGPRVKRSGGEKPLCWSEQYLRPELDRTPLIRGDFDAEQMRGHRIEQEICADVLSSELAAALGAAAGSPALVVIRRHAQRGRMISVGIHTHPADRFSIRTQFTSG